VYSTKCFIVAAMFFIAQPVTGTDQTFNIDIRNSNNKRAVLIFLDDSESDDAIGIITNDFLVAFFQQAGPIIVSASIIDNARLKESPTTTDLQMLIKRYKELEFIWSMLNNAEVKEMRNIARYFASFDVISAARWIIKEITPELYLFIPRAYLKMLAIDESGVALRVHQASITAIERQLGLKVNHMKTITDIEQIKKTRSVPYAYYFMDALYNSMQGGSSTIFVTKREYHQYKDKHIPSWTMYVSGHGSMGTAIVYLPVSQFKNFLNFLEYEIQTTLLYYWSCYAAGITSKELYKEVKNGIDRTYPFAVITQAITDAAIFGVLMNFRVDNNNCVRIIPFKKYDQFVKVTTSEEVIDYKQITACIVPEILSLGVESLLPQLKLPGLPWFSVIHEDKVCSIGSVLAETRTKPLNIERFFARRGKKAAPLGILLYPADLPFELIINSKTEQNLPPAMISMMPGDALHHIHKLSSSVHSVEDLIRSFLQIRRLGPHKLFFIDEIHGKRNDCSTITIRDVVIALRPQNNTFYYMHNGTLFKNAIEADNEEDAMQYKKLLQKRIVDGTKKVQEQKLQRYNLQETRAKKGKPRRSWWLF
jgi:hypothetical protein